MLKISLAHKSHSLHVPEENTTYMRVMHVAHDSLSHRDLGQGHGGVDWEVGGAVSQRLNGYSVLKFTEVALAAAELGVSISDLMDDKYLLQDEDFTSRLDEADNKKATGNTPMASNELLRLGLNQRPSD